MAFICGWLLVVFSIALAFRIGTEDKADSTLMTLVQLAVAYGVCSGIAFLASFLALRESWSTRLGYVLIGAMTIAGIGMAVNLGGYCTFPGTWEQPFFGEAFDFEREWNRISFHQQTGGYLPGTNIGFTWIASFMVGRLGPGISGLLIFNIMCMCGTVACTARISSVLLEGSDRKRVSFYAALVVASVASMIWYATVLMKEASATFAFSLVAVSLAKLYKDRMDGTGYLSCIAGSVLLMWVKSPLAWLIIIGIVVACVRRYLMNRKEAVKCITSGIYMLLIVSAVIIGGKRFRFVSDQVIIGAVESQREGLEDVMTFHSTVQRYSELIPGYFTAEPQQRLVYLPLCAAAQYFPPFPWNFTRDRDEGRFVWYAHLSIFWYLVGGAALGYLFVCFPKRKARSDLGGWLLWWIVCYVGLAYVSGGTVARYYLPLIPCLIPLSLRFVQSVRNGWVTVKATKIYCITYAVLLCTGLAAAYLYLQC